MSEDSAGTPELQRGQLLLEQGRHAEAADYFGQALQRNPHDVPALRGLALCQLQLPEQKAAALRTMQAALRCEPNSASNHAIQSHVLSHLDRHREALAAAREAVGLDPDSLLAARMETQALMGLERWSDAEQSARRNLALDPDDQTAANQLAHALRLQGKMAENADRVAWLLERDPEDAMTHSTAGWAALQNGRHRQAEEHFLEALRIDPTMESAREGLLDSFRARSAFYRLWLAYSFRMVQLSRGARWAVVIGLYLGVKFARAFLTGPYAPLATALGVCYLLFVLWGWLARGLGNFILLFDRFARHALNPGEKWQAISVGGVVCLALLLIGGSLAAGSHVWLTVGFSVLAASVPFAMTFPNRSLFGRWFFGSLGVFALLTGGAVLLSSYAPSVLTPKAATTLLLFALGGALLSTWLGNIRFLRR